jgi:hypothetical protein
LFSRAEVATFINDKFEAAWESLRPVPIVRIDFGNGNVITRTLHGNIATYVCDSEGEVIDVIPGIYTPDVYMKRLNETRLLAQYVGKFNAERRAETLQQYHQARVERPAKPAAPRVMDGPKTKAVEGGVKAAVAAAAAPGGAAAVPVPRRRLDAGKMVAIERPVAALVAAQQQAQAAAAAAAARSPEDLTVPADLASWRLLREDTESNEAVRRRQIDTLLARSGLVRPAAITRPIYKDVLHADLDDPYLGLGQALFGSYPFAKEESKP